MKQTNTTTMNNLQTLQTLRSELKTLASDWNETHNQLDANFVIVTLPSKMWRVAKELGCRKDYHYGYILFSKSTNSNGSDFACEVQSICRQHGAPVIVRERQL